MLVAAVDQAAHIQALAVVVATAGVGDRDHARARFRQEARGHATHVAEALHDHPQVLQAVAAALGQLFCAEEDAAAGGLGAPLAAADRDRLAGDDGGHRVAVAHGIGVHHPGHHAGVGAHVRGGDVAVGAE